MFDFWQNRCHNRGHRPAHLMFANRMHNLHIIYAAPYTINRYHDRLFRFGWMTNKILSENFLPLPLLHRSSSSASNGMTDKFGIVSEINNARSCLIGLCSLVFIAFGRAAQSGREKFFECESIIWDVLQNGNTNKLAHNTWISTQSTGEATFRFPFRFGFMTIRVLAATIVLSLLLLSTTTHPDVQLSMPFSRHDVYEWVCAKLSLPTTSVRHIRRISDASTWSKWNSCCVCVCGVAGVTSEREKTVLSSILISFALLSIGLGGKSFRQQ